MTVHMFRCFVGRGPMSITDLETRIDDWAASNAEWEDDSVEHTLTERNTEIDGSGETYWAIDVRFLPTEDKANLLQKYTDKLVNKVAWYRVGYHNCTHRVVTESVTGEEWAAVHESPVALNNDQVVEGSETVFSGGATYERGSDYGIDYDRGFVTAYSTGNIDDGQAVTINYDHQRGGGPCSFDPAEDPEALAEQWTAKDVTIPAGVPDFPSAAYQQP